jgi:hypothetical protein
MAAACQNLSRNVTNYVKDEPFKSLAVATAAGFVFGGGLNSRLGLAMITIGTRIALQGFVLNALAGAVAGRHHNGVKDRVDLEIP